MSLYRKLTPAEVLAMIAGAKSGVTQKPGGDSVTPPTLNVGSGVTIEILTKLRDGIRKELAHDPKESTGYDLIAAEPSAPEASEPATDVAPAGVQQTPPAVLSPSAKRHSKDRHKPSQAEYMRAYRARKKAEGGAGRGT